MDIPPYAAIASTNSTCAHTGRSSKAIHCGSFLFTSKFDGGNMESVELVEIEDPITPGESIHVYRIMVRSDNPSCDYRMRYHFAVCCADDSAGADSFGTIAEKYVNTTATTTTTTTNNSNNSSIISSTPSFATEMRPMMIEIVNLNPMIRCYTRNLSPHIATFKSGTHDLNLDPTINSWKRLHDKTKYSVYSFCNDLHLKMTLTLQKGMTTILTSHLPHSYTSCQRMLDTYQLQYGNNTNKEKSKDIFNSNNIDENIYFKRELLVYSLEGARVDLLTITSNRGRSNEREQLPANAWRPGQSTSSVGILFPNRTEPRPHLFKSKKIIFLTARVHPGETPGSHVLNGIINFLLDEFDPRSIALRDAFVFKIVPMLNPDGVRRGNFRCNSRGINLNRQYSLPTPEQHPTIFALKEIIRLCSLLRVKTNNNDNKKKRAVKKKEQQSSNKSKETDTQPHFFGTGDRSLVAFVDFHSMSMRPGM